MATSLWVCAMGKTISLLLLLVMARAATFIPLLKRSWIVATGLGLYRHRPWSISKADSTDEFKAEVEGVVIRLDTADPLNKFVLQTAGLVEERIYWVDTWPCLFLSATVPGQMTLIENLTAGQS